MSDPLLPETTSDETDVGWGDDSWVDDGVLGWDDEPGDDEPDGVSERRDEARLRADRPPHHDRP